LRHQHDAIFCERILLQQLTEMIEFTIIDLGLQQACSPRLTTIFLNFLENFSCLALSLQMIPDKGKR
jgi:hypothetical protein